MAIPLIGCEAGYLNAARIKGSHAAIKTGMMAAEAAFGAVTTGLQGWKGVKNADYIPMQDTVRGGSAGRDGKIGGY